MGGKSNRPLLKGRIHSEKNEEESLPKLHELNGNDEVDDFFEDRHQTLLKDIASDNSEAERELEPELGGTEIMKLHSSESEDSEDSEEEDGDLPGNPEEEKTGWGARRKDWYGGDTNEFEIMEGDERDEALKDEEEEAIRMQKKALEGLMPEDFRDEDESETDPEKDESQDGKKSMDLPAASENVALEVMDLAAPEVPALVKEMILSHKVAEALQQRAKSNETLRVLYHLHSSMVTNVAYYLSLRTDPETQGTVNIRTHPVLLRILSIRKLLQKSSKLAVPEDLEEKEDMTPEDTATIEESGAGCTKNSSPKQPEVDGNADQENKESASLPKEAQHGGMNGVLSKEKKKSRKRRGRKRKLTEVTIEEDEEKIQEILATKHLEEQPKTETEGKRRSRKKLQKIAGVMDSQRKNEEGKRFASTDEDLVRKKQDENSLSAKPEQAADHPGAELQGNEDDDEVMRKMMAKKVKKEARKERKAAAAQPHVYRFDDKTNPDGKRKASSQVVKNKGLTRYRPRNKKTPRAKNRVAYANALKRRKGAVREYVGKPGVVYSGEASGINMAARKGSKLSEV
eukprot:TRINITY_DN568_c0_g1_i1.p2 TRINITY_DN568_c0_g1~~TRINITY_DN568_c0_g1_i1.p2  ORF type:complete len:571 (+),score=143.73 TRINITY_DN568_c0_g1_i1:378-2090(+)